MNANRLQTCCAALFLSFIPPALSAPLSAQEAQAIYTQHSLALELPYHADHAGEGRLTVDVLNSEDEVMPHTGRTVDATRGDGLWRQNVLLDSKVPYDELVWQRVRYRFRYNGESLPAMERVLAIQNILRGPVMRLLGQSPYLVDTPAAIRVIVRDERDGEIQPIGGTVRMELMRANEANDKARQIFAGRLDARGTVDTSFRFPEDLHGNYELHVAAETPLGWSKRHSRSNLRNRYFITVAVVLTVSGCYQLFDLAKWRQDRVRVGLVRFEVCTNRTCGTKGEAPNATG